MNKLTREEEETSYEIEQTKLKIERLKNSKQNSFQQSNFAEPLFFAKNSFLFLEIDFVQVYEQLHDQICQFIEEHEDHRRRIENNVRESIHRIRQVISTISSNYDVL